MLPATHFEANDGVVRCPALDDRLGAYILIDLLPSLGVYFDLLLTDAEEQGRSTAAYFKPPRAYNWMFSFDRAGTDVVLYQYENRDLRELLQKNGFSVGLGSRSDIAYLGHLGCKGMNVGCGYHGAHRPTCHMILSETETMVSQFAAFWRLYAATPLPHRSQPPGAGRRSGRRYTDRAIE
ncbi:MAG: hypothetical protein U0792_05380 [Gemmataceae bacterium]